MCTGVQFGLLKSLPDRCGSEHNRQTFMKLLKVNWLGVNETDQSFGQHVKPAAVLEARSMRKIIVLMLLDSKTTILQIHGGQLKSFLVSVTIHAVLAHSFLKWQTDCAT